MSKLVQKISLSHPPRLTAEILVYSDGANLRVRNEDQYPIFGKSCGSVTSAKRCLSTRFGSGWKVRSTVNYNWQPGNRPGTITFKTKEV